MQQKFAAFWQRLAGQPAGRLAAGLAERLRSGLVTAGIGLVLGTGVAYAALASFGAVEILLDLWRPQHTPGYVGWSGFNFWLLFWPTLIGLVIGGLLAWRDPLRPVELADVIHAAHKPDPAVSRTGGYVSLVKSILALGGGSSTGLYGPLIVLGASLAASTKRLLNLRPAHAEMALGAGVAAAISAAFSAPLAGILFAHEVVLRHYNLRFFAPVTLASAAAYVFAGTVTSRHITLLPAFETRMAGAVDIVLLLLLGLAAGLTAVVMMRGLTRLRGFVDGLALPLWSRPALAGLSVGLLAHASPSVLGPGLDTLSAMLQGEVGSGALAALLGLKLAAALVCLTLYFHGGVLAPALFVGGALGGLVAALVGAVAPVTGYVPDSGLFVLAGMAAMASSVVGAPLTLILLSLELSQNYAATTAIMVAIVMANLLSSRLAARSVFEPQLLARGVDLSLGRESLALQSTPVTELMSSDYLTLPADVRVGNAMDRMADASCAEAHLINPDGQWAGKICLYDLIRKAEDEACLPLQESTPLVLQAGDNALFAQTAMRDFIGEGVPVLDAGRLVGIVHEADLFAHARMVTHSVWQHDHDETVR